MAAIRIIIFTQNIISLQIIAKTQKRRSIEKECLVVPRQSTKYKFDIQIG